MAAQEVRWGARKTCKGYIEGIMITAEFKGSYFPATLTPTGGWCLRGIHPNNRKTPINLINEEEGQPQARGLT